MNPDDDETRRDAWMIARAALAAVDPREAVQRHVEQLVGSGELHGLAIGKAAAPMAQGLSDRLGPRLVTGLAVGPDEFAVEGWKTVVGDHPVPDRQSLAAGRCVADFVDAVPEDATLVVLLSGGASALVTHPIDGIGLQEIAAVTERLLRAGADIGDLNAVRRPLDKLKGGGILALCRGSVVTLILSDVVGDTIHDIGSGPTVPSPTGPEDALEVLRRFEIDQPAVKAALRQVEEVDVIEAEHQVIANVATAVEAAAAQAREADWNVEIVSTSLTGEAREVGRMLADRLIAAPPRTCLLAGGETTVTVDGSGLGGPSQELALTAVDALAGTDRVVMTLATDGRDGPTDAAGAFVDGTTATRTSRAASDALTANDSHRFFEALGDLVVTGPTGTNVNDLWIGLSGRK